jgi:hypothetical protein
MPTPNPVTLTRARQDSLRRLPRDGSQPRQPRRSPPQLPPVRTRPPLWPRRHPHDLPTRRLTNEAVITRPARLTHNRERFAADSARPKPRRLTHAISLRRHALILPFVAWVIPSLGGENLRDWPVASLRHQEKGLRISSWCRSCCCALLPLPAFAVAASPHSERFAA